MKYWAKILLVVGIVWLILVGVYVWYTCANMIYGVTCELGVSCPDMGGCRLEEWITGLLVLGIPSWIMFLVVAIWGRKK